MESQISVPLQNLSQLRLGVLVFAVGSPRKVGENSHFCYVSLANGVSMTQNSF